MMKSALIQVTREDVDQARRGNSGGCAVARAIRRAIPEARRLHVDIQTIRFTDGKGVRRLWLTPRAVQRLIVYFDAGEEQAYEPLEWTMRRSNGRRLSRQIGASPEDTAAKTAAIQARREAAAEGRPVPPDASTAGKYRTVETGGAKVRTSVGSNRAWGAIALDPNQARERAGDITPAPPLTD